MLKSTFFIVATLGTFSFTGQLISEYACRMNSTRQDYLKNCSLTYLNRNSLLNSSTFITMKHVFYLLILLIGLSANVSAEKVYDFNATCQQAYGEITKLKIAQGTLLLNEAKKQNPDNLIPYMLEGYIDFFELFLNEDPKQYNERKDNFSKRQDAYDNGPQNSPFYRYCLAVNLLQRATVRIKFGERFGAVFDFKKGYSLIKENQKNIPLFYLTTWFMVHCRLPWERCPMAIKFTRVCLE